MVTTELSNEYNVKIEFGRTNEIEYFISHFVVRDKWLVQTR